VDGLLANASVKARSSSTALPASLSRGRELGAILVESGRLKADDVILVAEKQRETGLRFGEAAIALGLIDVRDVEHVLAQQFDYPLLSPGAAAIAPDVVTAFAAQTETVEQIRALRSKLILKWLRESNNRRTIALISAEPGVGRSFTVANLAVAFAQLGRRTLVIDADLRRPRQHELFRVPNRIGLSTVLAGLSGTESFAPVAYLPRLHLLPAGPTPPNAHDLLARPAMAQLLSNTAQRFGVVLVDTPAWNEGNGAKVLAAEAGAAVLIVRAGHSVTELSVRVAQELAEHRATLLGVVINQH
jgi:receptor protein-tyrosine kinase